MHLAGEAYTCNIVGTKVGFLQRFGNGRATGSPPIFGALLGPSDLRRGEGLVLFRGRRDYVTLFVDDQSASAAGAYVNA
jgi:hypothetical protein